MPPVLGAVLSDRIEYVGHRHVGAELLGYGNLVVIPRGNLGVISMG